MMEDHIDEILNKLRELTSNVFSWPYQKKDIGDELVIFFKDKELIYDNEVSYLKYNLIFEIEAHISLGEKTEEFIRDINFVIIGLFNDDPSVAPVKSRINITNIEKITGKLKIVFEKQII